MLKQQKVKEQDIRLSICRDVLEAIFEECDQFDADETGGRIIGYYELQDDTLHLDICGMIGPGPQARRSQTSFFQDGEYQEAIFREIEAKHQKIEHLGNWHTHHVNGLDTLSSGDIATYQRTVNHHNHNTDFFYALLVTAKKHATKRSPRYSVKHFLFRRGESAGYEIPPSRVEISDRKPVFVDNIGSSSHKKIGVSVPPGRLDVNAVRSKAREIMADLYPNLKTFFSKETSSVYWKGPIQLVDDSTVNILLLETADSAQCSYSVTISGQTRSRYRSAELYLSRTFESPWKAIAYFERDLNREVFSDQQHRTAITQ